MATDLYSTDLATISGNDLYKAITEFVRLDSPPEARPREGYLLDFKADVSERFLNSVAALANTFGGLLIVGVADDDGRPEKLVGVASKGELKTQIASVIASNVFPCPPFEIAECEIPNDPDRKKLCVVRVRESQEICLLARKGEKYPVYVRVEDQSPPVDAFQLRSLLGRKAQNQNLRSESNQRLADLENKLFVCKYGSAKQGQRSDTYFQIAISPYNSVPVRLDLAMEKIFGSLVRQQNPGLEKLTAMGHAKVEFGRSRDWFEVRFLELQHDYERRWRVTGYGDIGFITQARWPIMPVGDFWSLYDVAADVARIATLARSFWLHTHYYGSFRLRAALQVGGLRFEPGKGAFSPLFYERLGNIAGFSLDSRGIVLIENPQFIGEAEIDLDYPGLSASLPETVTAILNQLLRSLGHGCDLSSLQQSVSFLIDWVNPTHLKDLF